MKTAKRLLSFILAFVMLFSVGAFSVMAEEATEESITLSDIDLSTTVGKAVSRLVSMGIINGYPDGTFGPDLAITRAEFCVVMVKFENMQDYINPEALTGFEDLDTDANYAWARPYVAMAVQRGIINGFEDGTFRAADPVTYEQAIKMIVCSLGYGESAKMPTIIDDWSSGYVAKAMQLRVTSGTSITNKTKPTTRGTVAILTSNALDAARNTDVDGQDVIIDKDTFEQLGYKEVKGIVTGTYITELYDARSSVPKNHVMIDDEIYEIGFSRDPNEYLGCEVKAIVKEADEFGDYDLVTSLEPTSKTRELVISAGCVGEYEDGILKYSTVKNGSVKQARIDEDLIVIFNNKYYDYDISNLKNDLKSGDVVLVDNNGDNRFDVARVNSYEVFVVASKSSSTQKITLMYGAEYKGETTITFPEESTSLAFSLTRNGKEIKFSDISTKWDVLSIKESPEDALGRRLYEVIVTRETVSGTITERDASDESIIVINDKEYTIADSLLNYTGEDAPNLKVGEAAQVYLDHEGKIVAAAEANDKLSSEKYAYLLSLRQDDDQSDYDLEFWMYTTDGKFLEIGAASKITIDGVKYKALNSKIPELLEESAEKANSYYADAENVKYQQPIIYQTNTEGLVNTIYTVNSEENEDISMVLDDEKCFAEYKERKYISQNKTFTDFKISSSTDIVFIPDDRNDTDSYLTFSSYSKAFANGRTYHVEAYGITETNTAALVLIYKENDARIYTSSTPFLIVSAVSQTKDGTVIKGYNGTTYTEKTLTFAEETISVRGESCPAASKIGKGDVIRYIADSTGKQLLHYQTWFDASDPEQLESVSDLTEAANKRILAIHNTSTEPQTPDYSTAAFRLQYGTVTQLTLKSEDENTVDEESITVAPTVIEDDIDMVYDGTGVVERPITSSVKVFYYDRGGRNSEVITDADLTEILPYDEYGDDATRVITYSSSLTLRMIYIIAE